MHAVYVVASFWQATTSGGKIVKAHAESGLLTCCAAPLTIRVDAQIVVSISILISRHSDRLKRKRMKCGAASGVEGRDAHEPMNAASALDIRKMSSIGKSPLSRRFFARLIGISFDNRAVTPAQIHAQ